MGAKMGTSHRFLYEERSLQKLEKRKIAHLVTMMYRVVINAKLGLLGITNLQAVRERNSYNVRSRGNLSLPKCRTVQYQSSFLPTGVNLWNATLDEIKNCESIEGVKRLLKDKTKPTTLLDVAYTRRSNVLMTRL